MTDSELQKLLKFAERFLVKSYGGKGLDFDQVLSDFGLRLAKQDLPDMLWQDYWDLLGHRALQWTIKDYLRRIRAVKVLQTVNDENTIALAAGEEEEEEDLEYELLREKLEKRLERVEFLTDKQRAAFHKRRYGLHQTKLESALATKVVKKLRRALGS